MNIKQIGLWGFFCIVSLALHGQTNIKKENTVEWSEPVTISQDGKSVTLLQFSDMGDVNPETDIAVLSQSIKLPQDGTPQNIQVSIENPVYIWPTPQEHAYFKNKVNNEVLEFSFSTSQNGMQHFIDLSLTPVVKPKDAPTFKKLASYTLLISYNIANPTTLKSTENASAYAQNSVLNSGNWVKVSVAQSGIHKISYSKLKEWGVNNPQNVGLYGNGGQMLPSSNNAFRHDDLVENAIWHNKEAIYFYAQGPVVWTYNNALGIFTHEKNRFSNYSYYYITEKNTPSLTIQDTELQTETYDKEINYFNDYDFHDEDNFNLLKSGNVWFGEKFDYYANPNRSFDFNFAHIKSGSSAHVYASLAARSGTRTTFEMMANDALVASTEVYEINTSITTSYFAREGILKGSFTSSSDHINLNIHFKLENSQTSAIGYLDYICLNVDRDLKFTGNQLAFRNMDAVGVNQKAKYTIQDGQTLLVWDITNPLKPLKINTTTSGSSANFNYEATTLKEFVSFDPSGSFPAPAFVQNVENQNLHATPFIDYIIVCHPDFTEQAYRLGNIHNEYNGMTFTVVTTEQIYNEFSSGKPDITAIRSFVRMLYDKAGTDNSKKPKNLLLFGDGSYDNREGIADNTNKIPTYQSDNSIHETYSFVSDDYLGLLDPSEGTNIQSNKLDIGIGRFPVNTLEEAKNAVDKTYKYYYEQSNDQWKNTLTFVGDDGDNNVHMTDANSLTTKLEGTHPEYNISKLYFDGYKKITTTTGHSIPELEQDINNAIHKGNLVFNYTGHGGPTLLGHERVITKKHIASWNNIDKLALFVTATCEFSRYDDKSQTSAGEDVFLNPLGGGIALFTTTRIVYSSLNKALNNSFYNFAFERNTSGNPYTLGEIMMHTKNGLAASINKLNFSLLGDPAIQLIYPKSKVSTLKLNDDLVMQKVGEQEIPAPIDSLKALSKIKVSGHVTDGLNQSKSDFSGEIFVSVYDKQSRVTTRGNDGATPFSYNTFDNIIFKGPASVTNGAFETEFIIPKDIRYNFDKGKISYYAYSSENKEEAFGAFSDVIIGGIDNTATDDNIGPEISLWLNTKKFSNGASVGPRPILIAEISDLSGINTTGNGIGHDITCIIDEKLSDPIILNNDFEATINSYQEGTIKRQLPSLDEGHHTLTVKAWDTYNNSSSSTINFKVSANGGIAISETIVFPNPVKPAEASYISFQHDDPNSRLDIQLLLYNMSGQLVSQQNKSVVSLINTIPPIELKAQTTSGGALNPGIYLYKLIIHSQSGRQGEYSGKIMVGR